jgi:hypothetical protein
VFCIYLRKNSDLCHLQHELIGFYNRDEKCLQRGTDWVFKYSSLRFVFKWLMWANLMYACVCIKLCLCVYVCIVLWLILSRKNGWPDIAPVRDKKFVRNRGLNPEGKKLFG